MAFNARQLQAIIELVRRDPEARRQLLSALEMDRLLEIPSRMDRLEATVSHLAEIVADLAASQRRAEERLGQVEEHLGRIEAALEKLTVSHVALDASVGKISLWQMGEDGRRKGGQDERRIQRRAHHLFYGGNGGGLHYEGVYRHLIDLLDRIPRNGHIVSEEADPLLSDLLWWKGDRYALAEISVKVDRLDVLRAAQRAATLRQGGVNVLAVVLGDEWTADETLLLARDEGVAWKVGDDLSPELLAYRQISPE